MPIFEYRCRDCGRISEVLVLSRTETVAPVCRKCGGRDLVRVPSRFRVAVSDETRLERLADLAERGGLDESDPRSMTKFLKQMGQALGEDAPGEVDQIVEETLAEAGGGGLGGDTGGGAGED